jgi:choline dehydrogenase
MYSLSSFSSSSSSFSSSSAWDSELVRKNGVQPLVHLPGVGKNLQDHLQIRSMFKLAPGADTLNTRAGSIWGMIKIGLEYIFKQSGPLSMAPSQMGMFATSEGYESPNLQWHVQPLSLDSWNHPLHKWDGLTAAVCNLRPTSRGSVTLNGADIRTPPFIDPNYLATDEDKKVAIAGLRMTRVIMMESEAFAQFEPVEYMPEGVKIDYNDDEALVRAAGEIGTSIFHPVGTCAIGAKIRDEGVVDHKLRVHGVSNLFVADASVMPTITSGNTNSPSVMIGEKAAAMILFLHRREVDEKDAA